jgi:photosystem I reaction center subunit XII
LGFLVEDGMVCSSAVDSVVSQVEIYIALIVALHGAVLAMRLCVSLYRA